MEIVKVEDVFTPTKPAVLTYVERARIDVKLNTALRIPGKQLVVYGHSGSGKTTLLVNKLKQLYEMHITTRCHMEMSFNDILFDAFDQIDAYVTKETTLKDAIKCKKGFSSENLPIKLELAKNTTNENEIKKERIVPYQTNFRNLATLIGNIKGCWVLEDFHKVKQSEKKKLSQMLKIFMDMAETYEELKIVAIGAVGTARQVVEYDIEMTNRIAEIEVPLMNETEIEEIITKGESLLNIRFDDIVKKQIVLYSNGLASVCHQLCLYCCYESNIMRTAEAKKIIVIEVFEKALNAYIDDFSDTMKSKFDKAFKQKKGKYDNFKIILYALSNFDLDGAPHKKLLAEIKKDYNDYPPSNLTTNIKKLCSDEKGAIVKWDTNSDFYSFSQPIYKAYVLALKREPKRNGKDAKIVITNEVLDELKKILETMSIRKIDKKKKKQKDDLPLFDKKDC